MLGATAHSTAMGNKKQRKIDEDQATEHEAPGKRPKGKGVDTTQAAGIRKETVVVESAQQTDPQPSDNSADLLQQLVTLNLQDENYSVLSRWLQLLPKKDLLNQVSSWEPTTVAIVVQSWPPKTVASILKRRKPSFVRQCCQQWEPEDIARILPCLKVVVARKVLDRLYFRSKDPHLSMSECRKVINSFTDKKRKKLCSRLNQAKLEKVLKSKTSRSALAVTHSSHSEDSQTDDTYDYSDSFLNDGSVSVGESDSY